MQTWIRDNYGDRDVAPDSDARKLREENQRRRDKALERQGRTVLS